MSVRRTASMAVVVVGVLFAFVAAAWACSAVPSISVAGPPSGSAGSVLALQGRATAAGAPVEIRWNELRGPVLGTAVADAGGNYVTNATLPQAQPGIYTIIAVSDDKPVARLAVELTPTPGVTAAGNAHSWQGVPAEVASPSGWSFDRGLMVGAAVLGLGLVGVASGAGAAALSRRRVAVEQGY